MNEVKTLKAQAKNLQTALVASGTETTLGAAQDLVAKQYGLADWNTLVAVVKAPEPESEKRQLCWADVTDVPDEVWIEDGPESLSYNVDAFDTDLLPLLDTMKTMADRGPVEDCEDEDPVLMDLQGDGHRVELKLSDLLGAKYEDLGGKDYWLLADGRYLRFDYLTARQPSKKAKEKAPKLSIPRSTKTAKGFEVIVVPCNDLSADDAIVLVPPGTSAREMSEVLLKEIDRLKIRDVENEGNPDYSEYTEEDMREICARHNCLWVIHERTKLSREWD